MYILVLVACMSFGGDTQCQSFERDHLFASENRCRMAAAIERGQYADRAQQRADWLTYDWLCQPDRISALSEEKLG